MRVCEAYGFYPEDEARIFPLLVCQTILLPGQGLLNVFVYVRPAFNKARKDYPNESYFWSFRRAMFGDRVKPEFGQSVGRRASTQFNVGLLSSLQTSMRNLRVPSHNSSMNDSSAEHPPRPSLLSRVPTSSFRNLMAASKQGFASDDDGDTTPSLMGRIRRGLASETKMAYSSGDDSLYSGPRMPRERPPNSILKDEYSEIQDIEKRRVSFAESDSSFSEEQEKETAPKRDDKEAEKASSSDSDSSYSDEKPKLRGMGNSNRMIRLGDINSSFSDCDSEEDKTEEKDDEQEQEHIKDEDGEDDEDSQF